MFGFSVSFKMTALQNKSLNCCFYAGKISSLRSEEVFTLVSMYAAHELADLVKISLHSNEYFSVLSYCYDVFLQHEIVAIL